MEFRNWEDIPEFMQNDEVKKYYEILCRKRVSLKIKRSFDISASVFLIILLSPVFLFLTIWIKLDSRGPVYYKQERVTQYGRKFSIFKFRTMVTNADKKGTLVTLKEDPRITKAGKKLRKLRLDELPQLFNIAVGDMSFVGTRPEGQKYVDEVYIQKILPEKMRWNLRAIRRFSLPGELSTMVRTVFHVMD